MQDFEMAWCGWGGGGVSVSEELENVQGQE